MRGRNVYSGVYKVDNTEGHNDDVKLMIFFPVESFLKVASQFYIKNTATRSVNNNCVTRQRGENFSQLEEHSLS